MPPADFITLGNLSEQLPQWLPDGENHLYAVVDMGSNGIRFSITSLAPPTTRLLLPVYSTRAAISLFDALIPSPSGPVFSPSTIETVSSLLARFHQVAIMFGVLKSHTMILATEAMRRAANAAEMLEAIAKATGGIGVRILAPSVETLLGAVMGSRSGLVHVKGGGLFLDLGGGSVQMTWVDTSTDRYEIHAAMAGESLPYGAARLIRVLEEEPAHVQQMEIDKLRDGILRIYAHLCSKFPPLEAIRNAHESGQDAAVNVYMCGGGFRGYGSMLMHKDDISPYPIFSISTYSVPGRFFRQTSTMLRENEDYGGKIFGLSKRRRRQFPAIVAVINAFIAAIPNIGRVTFCGGSNRQGALMMTLPLDVRESNPLDVLAGVTRAEKEVFDAILQLLSAALPAELLSDTPTMFNLGLGPLLVREIWTRGGYDADTNSAFALHDAITRYSDCPGLTHLSRAILGLGVCARWGGGLGPVEAQLRQGLRRIADSHKQDASLWAIYVGAVSGVIATIFPMMPKEPHCLLKAVRFGTRVTAGGKGNRDKIILEIGLASEYAKGIDTEGLVDDFESTMGDKGNKPTYKFSARVTSLE